MPCHGWVSNPRPLDSQSVPPLPLSYRGRLYDNVVTRIFVDCLLQAHPHLSQALLGAGTSASSSTHPTPSTSLSGAGDPTSTSLIKSLLANKVGQSDQSAGSSSSSVSCSATQPNTALTSQVSQKERWVGDG